MAFLNFLFAVALQACTVHSLTTQQQLLLSVATDIDLPAEDRERRVGGCSGADTDLAILWSEKFTHPLLDFTQLHQGRNEQGR